MVKLHNSNSVFGLLWVYKHGPIMVKLGSRFGHDGIAGLICNLRHETGLMNGL